MITLTIDNALKIEGWMDEPNLWWLAQKASEARNIVEIGCWKGRSATVLADNTPGTVWAIDTWLGSEEHHPPVEGLYQSFCDNMQPYIDMLKIYPLRMTSVEGARALSGRKYDMIFIDASHDYDSIRADILAWRPLVAPGGLLCGHDAGHPPIIRALDELLPDRLPNECSMWQVRL